MTETVNLEQALREQRRKLDNRHLQEKAALLSELKDKLGEQVVDVVQAYEGRKAKEYWASIAEQHGGNAIEDLITVLWKPLAEQGMQYTSEEKDGGIQMHCTSCPLHEIANELGITEWAYHIFCSTDPYIVAGFNPNMGFKRSKTLMQGDDCCNHFYYYKKD